MTKLEQLIKNFCPNGVEYKLLRDIVDYEQPTKYIVHSTVYSNDYKIPVLTAGKSFILGYTNETEGIYNASKQHSVIIFDDFTTSFHWVDFAFKIKSSAMKMLTSKNIENASLRYIFYAMQCITYSPTEHTRQWIGTYSNFCIPVPPLAVQNEIVRILDIFTELAKELRMELTERKRQYTYYLHKLLDFSSAPDIEWVALNDVVKFRNGKGHEQNIVEDGKYIVINSKFVSTSGKTRKYTDYQLVPLYKEDIVMVMSDLPAGKALAKCYFVEENGKYTLNQRVGGFTVKTNDILSKFLYYVLDRNSQLLKYDNGVDQTNLRKDDILRIKIPIPPLAEQERIIKILDGFEALCNDISVGLPAEIKARQQQYEYYRNKLLTFEEVKA